MSKELNDTIAVTWLVRLAELRANVVIPGNIVISSEYSVRKIATNARKVLIEGGRIKIVL